LNWGGSISDQQLTWIENELESYQSNDLNYMVIHHNPLWETTHESLLRKEYENREQLLDIIDEYNIDMVFAGHVHYDNITLKNTTIFATTTTPESRISIPDGYWGYRLITVKNNTISSYNYKEPKYSIPTYKIHTEESTAYRKMVTNELDIPITAHLKFILPKGTYTAQNGIILNQRNNTIMTELYVQTLVPAKNNSQVVIQQT
jgi:3',5'-cyclic AMP phosphodiesterase CpdA